MSVVYYVVCLRSDDSTEEEAASINFKTRFNFSFTKSTSRLLLLSCHYYPHHISYSSSSLSRPPRPTLKVHEDEKLHHQVTFAFWTAMRSQPEMVIDSYCVSCFSFSTFSISTSLA